MKTDLVVDLLTKCDITCEVEQNDGEVTIYGYSDELQFEMYVIFSEDKDGVLITAPLTPEIENVGEEAMELINDFYDKNESMVDLVLDDCLLTELYVEDAKEKDLEYYLSEFLNFFADDEYIDAMNLVINKLMEDNM